VSLCRDYGDSFQFSEFIGRSAIAGAVELAETNVPVRLILTATAVDEIPIVIPDALRFRFRKQRSQNASGRILRTRGSSSCGIQKPS